MGEEQLNNTKMETESTKHRTKQKNRFVFLPVWMDVLNNIEDGNFKLEISRKINNVSYSYLSNIIDKLRIYNLIYFVCVGRTNYIYIKKKGKEVKEMTRALSMKMDKMDKIIHKKEDKQRTKRGIDKK